jgi:hypothetical protein
MIQTRNIDKILKNFFKNKNYYITDETNGIDNTKNLTGH